MSSYFDEHNCTPLGEGEVPDHFLHFARLLIDTGAWMQDEFSALFQGKTPPPASKKFIDEEVEIRENREKFTCPICLKAVETDEDICILPCKHKFHPECIKTWLRKTNSCPMCRKEFPTDDEDYEEMQKHRKRADQRKEEIEVLHNSMFG